METRIERAPRGSWTGLIWRPFLWAIPFTVFFGLLSGGSLEAFKMCFVGSLVFAYLIMSSLRVVDVWVCPWIRTRWETSPRLFWWITGAYAAAAMTASYIAAFICNATIYHGLMGSSRGILMNGMFTLLFTAMFAGIGNATAFYRKAMERAQAVEQMRAELAQAELRALRAQIQPHFLFNTLNSIAALIPMNPQAAEETLTRLAEVFRYTLKASERDQVPLGEELQFLRNYLEIERTRLGERLRLEEKIAPGLEAALVPGLLLQPVVENAVRHGIGRRAEGGSVGIEARVEGGSLVLEIRDDGPGMGESAAAPGNGFGLHSVRERLNLAGPGHGIEIDSNGGRGTRVRITLPFITQGA